MTAVVMLEAQVVWWFWWCEGEEGREGGREGGRERKSERRTYIHTKTARGTA